ncbi:MAG: carbohydrate ABC transporter substrate-binding protein [Ruminococcaceae bacterium]|nr:carbohydrate ABC transporter substrate-binding protein [Oscillospiraceae bacterium]
MKKLVTVILILSFLAPTLSSCTTGEKEQGGVEISVVTMYGGDDGNRAVYQNACYEYETISENTINDSSAQSSESWKAKVVTDFEVGAEPDVLFFFTGTDSDPFVRAGKVVSVDEIRKVYPNYAANMDYDMFPASAVDNECYAVPVNGYWESLYVNKTVFSSCGLELPDENYTWDKFLSDCAVIRDNGYTPIALSAYPHYWFEYFLYNECPAAVYGEIPAVDSGECWDAWVAALNKFKEFYELGFFPENYLTATDDETCRMMVDNSAAFLLDGSWKINYFIENGVDENIALTYVPGAGARATTDIIGGLSAGYYITQKAGENEEKRAACVDFISFMTSDEMVSKFGAMAITALSNGTLEEAHESELVTQARIILAGATDTTAAVQDSMDGDARTFMFESIRSSIVTGNRTAEDVLREVIGIKS